MQKPEKLEDIVNHLVSATDPDEVRQLYQQWSDSYDDDLDSFGYVAPEIGAGLFAETVKDKAAKIHDAGCGTGLVGALLKRLGYSNIHGSDFSAGMLDRAQLTNCYKTLELADFSQPLSIADNTFDAVISIGVYTKRFKQIFLTEVLRTLKPAGSVVFTCRELYFDEVADTVKQMHADKIICKSSVQFNDYMTGQNASAFYVVLEKSRENSGE